MPNKFNFADFGMQAAQDVVGAGLGLALGGINDKRQLKQQGKLQNLQIQGQKQMMDYSMGKQMEMWNATNYQAQMEQLRKAGLNPGLIYGMSGGGGATLGQPSGNVTGGNAPTGGGEAVAMSSTMAQLGLMRAQRELIEAQTKKELAQVPVSEAQVPNIQAHTASLLQGVENAKAQQKLTELQTEIGNVQLDFDKGTLENRKSTVNLMLSKLIEETKIMENERLISDATIQTKVKILRAELAIRVLEQYLIKAETINIDQQTRESIRRVSNMIQANMRAWMDSPKDMSTEMSKEGIWNNESIPGEIKDILDNILIIPGRFGIKGGTKPVTGFHDRGGR